jgi:hypothetical protein
LLIDRTSTSSTAEITTSFSRPPPASGVPRARDRPPVTPRAQERRETPSSTPTQSRRGQAPHPPGPTGRPEPRRKTTAVGSRYPRGLDLVRVVPGDLAEAGAAGDPPDPAGPPPGRGRRAVLPDPPRPVPVGAQAGRTQGTRLAWSRQEPGVDVSSDSSEPPMESPHRLQGEPRARTAHLAPKGGSR